MINVVLIFFCKLNALSCFFGITFHYLEEEELVKEEALEVEQNLETEFNVLEEHELKTFQAEVMNIAHHSLT